MSLTYINKIKRHFNHTSNRGERHTNLQERQCAFSMKIANYWSNYICLKHHSIIYILAYY